MRDIGMFLFISFVVSLILAIWLCVRSETFSLVTSSHDTLAQTSYVMAWTLLDTVKDVLPIGAGVTLVLMGISRTVTWLLVRKLPGSSVDASRWSQASPSKN
jgi:hypothetical protein